MNYKIENGKLLIYENDEFKIVEDDLYITDGEITSIGSRADIDDSLFEKINAADHLVMPGLINMHTHAYMTPLRNYADDVDFAEWLFNRVNPVEDNMTAEDAYTANLLAFAEMIMSGTTAYTDMHMFRCQSAKAAKEAGMRALIGRGLVGDDLYTDGYRRFREALDELEEYSSDMIRFSFAPHAIYTCSPKFYEQVTKEADKYGVLKQTHLSEGLTEVNDSLEKYGKTPVALLKDTGFLDNAILAHCVQMRDNDIAIIKECNATVATNPASNAKLGNGFAPVKAFLDADVNLCIGTDGTSSNNTLNMFREIGLLSLIHKGINKDSTAMPAQTAIKAATINAAKALGMEGKLGIIKEGARADLIFLDLKLPNMFPANNILSSLCYSANGSEVDSVMIDGRFVMKDRVLTTIDLEKVFADSSRWSRFLK